MTPILRSNFLHLFCLALLMLALSCHSDDDQAGAIAALPDLPNNTITQPNILLIIADDMGKDATPGFSEGTIKPNTPNIDKVRNEGLSFNNFWVNPTCSPTRASIITGKYGYRTDVKWAGDELSSSEKILQQYISEETNDAYATAIVGKWHLSGNDATVNPENFGVDHFTGLIRGSVQDYFQWQLSEDGNSILNTDYTTEVFTDLAIDWINDQSKPWFLWLAHNAPHTPFHVPPTEMHNQGNLPDYVDGMDGTPYFMAAIEAMDYQIGKLLESIPEEELDNTVIIFMGDNGTPNQVAQLPYSSNTAKGTLSQGGINVPLFISGAGVSRTGEDNNLVCNTDLFATIAQLAGSQVSEINDSKSFVDLLSSDVGHRSFQYTEMKSEMLDAWAITNGRYKLIVDSNGEQEYYDLEVDPYEANDLLSGNLTEEEGSAKEALEAELSNIRN
ncbi:MAG: sulfatase-like hydrolase/transferase [Saprospiraceae bacterium]